MCGCNSPKIPTTAMPASLLSSSGNFTPDSVVLVTDPDSKAQMVVLEYTGPNQATFTINSRSARGISYRFGNNDQHRIRPVLVDDVKFLLGLNSQGVQDFHVLSNIATAEAPDPAAFLRYPITA